MTNEGNKIGKDVEDILKSVAQSENIESYDLHLNKIQGEGFMSEFFIGEVINKDNGKSLPVAIKKALVGGNSPRDRSESLFNNEVLFYTEIFPELDKFQREMRMKHPFMNIPRCLKGSIESENMFIVMENLKPKGYILFDKKECFDTKHFELIFKTYGKFHALSFTFKQKNPKKYKNLVEKLKNLFELRLNDDDLMDYIKRAYLGAIDTFDPVSERDIITKLRTVLDVKETLKKVEIYRGNYACLTHGDCWSNNMLFKYKASGEPEDIRLIDFQITCSSTPVHDLSYFFYSGASKEVLDKLGYYLDLYYESFSNSVKELGGNPEEIYPIDVLKKDWKEYGILGIFRGCQVWLVKLMDTDEIAKLQNEINLSPDKTLELWLAKQAEVISGALYRERTRSLCLHAVEYGLL